MDNTINIDGVVFKKSIPKHETGVFTHVRYVTIDKMEYRIHCVYRVRNESQRGTFSYDWVVKNSSEDNPYLKFLLSAVSSAKFKEDCNIVYGNRQSDTLNQKITVPEHLARAELIIKNHLERYVAHLNERIAAGDKTALRALKEYNTVTRW